MSVQHEEWEQRFVVPETMRMGLAQLQEASLEVAAQMRVANSQRGSEIARVKPQMHFGSPKLSARRNASLLTLARAASPSPRMDARVDTDPAYGGTGMAAIETTAQFLEWYSQVEGRLAAEQDAESHAFASHMRRRLDECARMEATLGSVEAALDTLHMDFGRVGERTGGVRTSCGVLQTRQGRLEQMAGQINERLDVYGSLGPITQLFNAPGDSVCTDPEFLPSLERAERALEFIEAHADARDSELYAMRFAQCRSRALTLIKMHAQREFRRLGAQTNANTASAEHVRVRAAATRLRPLLEALQQRGTDIHTNAPQVLADVEASYFQMRRVWLHAHVPRALQSIEHEHTDRAAVLRDWCAFVMGVCADEGRLYAEFFGTSTGTGLKAHEDAVMKVFYELVRPRIIREAQVDVLAALSLTLLAYQRPQGDEPGESDESSELDAFYAVVGAVLEDAQQRLAFRAQAFVRGEIGGYRMSADDAAAAVQWIRTLDQGDQGDPVDHWEYPPVQRLRWLVTHISGCVDTEVQRGLTEEALAACKQSIATHGARTVRDCMRGDSDAEQLAHLFVTCTITAADQAAEPDQTSLSDYN
ncbi:Golgi transport complex subunit 3 [Coemansia sp. RSA 1822]|nr:Golgi transport complex subunit 3 [Coemansia sp. RSA 638]KAJ2543925.1 Golgi transport complex subunit 3 [Coemansia sp. RSA 1853]KAJ2565468.1 Golgi transport complex subunit 3 [Coemansia sp. RSA 1822]